MPIIGCSDPKEYDAYCRRPFPGGVGNETRAFRQIARVEFNTRFSRFKTLSFPGMEPNASIAKLFHNVPGMSRSNAITSESPLGSRGPRPLHPFKTTSPSLPQIRVRELSYKEEGVRHPTSPSLATSLYSTFLEF